MRDSIKKQGVKVWAG